MTKAIRFDEAKWAELSKIAKERGTTTASLIRETMYSLLSAKKDGAKR